MAFVAPVVVALLTGGALGSYWWWGDANVEVPTAPTIESTKPVASVPTVSVASRSELVVEPTLIDELKIALAKRRARQAPGTC
jgi:hypothetical protein